MITACTSPESTRTSNRAMPGRFGRLADSPPSTMMSTNSALLGHGHWRPYLQVDWGRRSVEGSYLIAKETRS